MNTKAARSAPRLPAAGRFPVQRYLRYAGSFIIPAVTLVAIALTGWWSWLTPIIAFAVFPVIELFVKGSTENLGEDAEREAQRDRVFDAILYLMVPIQYAIVALTLYVVASTDLALYELVGLTVSTGLCCGTLGINAAHELGHRRRPYEQRMAKALLLTTLYMHFFIEHNRGHHARVATDEDPATARRGEWLFAYLPRSIFMSWIDAWNLENDRLRKKGVPAFSPQNEMIRFHVIEALLLLAIFLAAGPTALGVFVGASIIGILLLETVNYVEHYGLRRRKLDNGRYERVLPIHSWNANHPIGRVALFELTRHSDHHANARRKYQTLRHFDESPQLPTGYPGMVLLAWFPPLWFAVMHRHIAAWEGQRSQQQSRPHHIEHHVAA